MQQDEFEAGLEEPDAKTAEVTEVQKPAEVVMPMPAAPLDIDPVPTPKHNHRGRASRAMNKQRICAKDRQDNLSFKVRHTRTEEKLTDDFEGVDNDNNAEVAQGTLDSVEVEQYAVHVPRKQDASSSGPVPPLASDMRTVIEMLRTTGDYEKADAAKDLFARFLRDGAAAPAAAE